MTLLKAFFYLLFLALVFAFWPIALIIAIFIGLMKLGMKRDFEP